MAVPANAEIIAILDAHKPVTATFELGAGDVTWLNSCEVAIEGVTFRIDSPVHRTGVVRALRLDRTAVAGWRRWFARRVARNAEQLRRLLDQEHAARPPHESLP